MGGYLSFDIQTKMTEKLSTLDRKLIDLCIGNSILSVGLAALEGFYFAKSNPVLSDEKVLALGLFSALPAIVGSIPLMYNHFKKDRTRGYEHVEVMGESEERELAKAG